MEIEKTRDKHKDNSIIPFGVGLFIFSVVLEEQTTIEDIILDFSETLRNIPGLSSLRIEPEFYAPQYLMKGKNDLRFLNINFEINLDVSPKFRDGNDKFKVINKPLFYTSLTIIVSESFSDDPSFGVFKVREYLQKYFKGKYSLEVTGPSPFHADFFLKKKCDHFEIIIRKQKGYDQIKVFSTRPDEEGSLEEFFEETESELDLFYFIQETEMSRIKQWEDVEEKIQGIEKGRPGSLWRRIKKYFLLNSNVADIVEDTISFESMSLSTTQSINRAFGDTEIKYFSEYLEKERKNSYIFPIESVKRLIDFKSSKRARFNQNLITLLNTIVSVALTAAITYLFYKVGIKP